VNLSATARIGGCRHANALLEILREIPDHRRVEGRGSILRPCCSIRSSRWWRANSYGRCMSSSASIAVSQRRFASNCVMRVLHGLRSSCTASIRRIGERLSAPRVDARRAAATEGFGDRGGRQNLRAASTPFATEAAHMMTALRHATNVLAHVMVAEKSNEIPTAPELIEALGVKDRLFTLDAEHCQKNRSRA